jgi:hypothetical protein
MAGFLAVDHMGEPSTYGVVVPDPEHPFVAPLYLVEGKSPDLRLGRHASSVNPPTISPFEAPLQPNTATEKAIAVQTECVGAVVVRFTKYETDERAVEIGSGFSVGPGLVVTARHMVLHPSGDPAWKVTNIHFVLSEYIIASSVRPTDDKYPNYMCELLSTANIEGQPEEVQTQNGLKAWKTKYDAVFLAVSEDVYKRVGCLIPFSPSMTVDELPFVCAVGFPLRPNENAISYLFPMGIVLPGEERLITASQILEFRKQTLDGLFNFNFKMVSPGQLLDFETWNLFATKQMLRLSLTVIGGVSGGPCIITKLPHLFVGLTSGAFNGDKFNVAVSVHHPLFVAEYLDRVVPEFIELRKMPPPALQGYVNMYKNALSPEVYERFMALYH